MPVLEAGLLGMPVVSSDQVPATREIGREYIHVFDPNSSPEHIAELILEIVAASPTLQFRRNVRLSRTWERIFKRQILPLLGSRA